jgi:hypothetical protein
MSLPIDIELYLRTYMNDLGTTLADNQLKQQTDTFNLIDQDTFTLTQTPNTSYTPICLFDDLLIYSPDFYMIVGTAGTLTAQQTGTLTVTYWY